MKKKSKVKRNVTIFQTKNVLSRERKWIENEKTGGGHQLLIKTRERERETSDRKTGLLAQGEPRMQRAFYAVATS